MKIKVLLFTDYGGNAYTPAMRKIMGKSDGIRCRVGEIIDYVENNCVSYDTKRLYEDLRRNKELIAKYGSKYGVWNESIRHTTFFSIVEVDTTRPWTINEYDGAEYIKYLDEHKLIDRELNYWEIDD